jgi:hypothetical protein
MKYIHTPVSNFLIEYHYRDDFRKFCRKHHRRVNHMLDEVIRLAWVYKRIPGTKRVPYYV